MGWDVHFFFSLFFWGHEDNDGGKGITKKAE